MAGKVADVYIYSLVIDLRVGVKVIKDGGLFMFEIDCFGLGASGI
jgi:hypothetical protein